MKYIRFYQLVLASFPFLMGCQSMEEYPCTCGGSGDGPYVVMLSASSQEEAEALCTQEGPDCAVNL